MSIGGKPRRALKMAAFSSFRSRNSSLPPAPFQSINSDAWRVTYPSPPTLTPDVSPLTFPISRQGFDTNAGATTYVDAYTLTKLTRQFYPNQSLLTSDQVAVNDYIYSTDSVNGVTNNQAETSPKPIANWVMPDRLLVGNTIELEIVAFHRDARYGEQVACVEFRATDGTTTVTQKVSSSQVSGRAGDQNAVIVYKCSLDVSTLSNPATITVNAKVYPWIGGAASVLDSADSSVAREFSPRTFRRDTALLAAPRVAYVRTTGNDGTGVVSTTPATASANPFLTVLGAINAHHTAGGMDGAVIYIGDDGGTPFVLGSTASTRTQSHTCCTITRESGVARANARVSWGAASFRARFGTAGGWLRFYDVGIVRTGTLSFTGEATSLLALIFDDVSFDNASYNAGFYTNCAGYFYGVAFSGLTATPLNASTYEHRIFRGLSGAAGGAVEQWLMVGCNLTNMATLQVITRTGSGAITAFNKFLNINTITFLAVGDSSDAFGVAIVQNVFEYVGTSSGWSSGISNDSKTGNTSHVIVAHNTYAGFWIYGRVNHFYDEGPTPRTHKLHRCYANIYASINTKGDVFVADGTRQGNQAYTYGVGCQFEFSQFIDASSGGLGSSFAQNYPGLNANIGTSSTVRNDPLFTNYQGTTSGPTVGAGGGTYTLQAGSPCKGVVTKPVLKFDLAGNARSLSAASIGAYE